MNEIKFKSITLSLLILLSSCAKYEVEAFNINEATLKSIHYTIKNNLRSEKLKFDEQLDLSLDALEVILKRNLKVYNDFGMEQLFLNNGFNPNIISEIQQYRKKSIRYDDLVQNKKLESEVDALLFFTIIEIEDYIIKHQLKSNLKFDLTNLHQRMSWGCALAIASIISISVFAIISGPITGGASLIAFIGSKVIATTALIEACGPGWGDF